MRARIPPRLIGIVLLAASGGTTLAHRAVYRTAIHGPAQAAELVFALSTFMLASMGMLMLITGAKLFAAPRAAPAESRPLSFRDACDTRRGVAAMRAGRVRRYARTMRESPFGLETLFPDP